MVAIIFADLSVTLRIEHIRVEEDTTIRSIVNTFAENWECSDITIHGRPISEPELDYAVKSLARKSLTTGDLVLEIEKH